VVADDRLAGSIVPPLADAGEVLQPCVRQPRQDRYVLEGGQSVLRQHQRDSAGDWMKRIRRPGPAEPRMPRER
jgi:hypothetical protein